MNFLKKKTQDWQLLGNSRVKTSITPSLWVFFPLFPFSLSQIPLLCLLWLVFLTLIHPCLLVFIYYSLPCLLFINIYSFPDFLFLFSFPCLLIAPLLKLLLKYSTRKKLHVFMKSRKMPTVFHILGSTLFYSTHLFLFHLIIFWPQLYHIIEIVVTKAIKISWLSHSVKSDNSLSY